MVEGSVEERVAQALERWKGHILMPAPRKASRERTFEAIKRDVMDALKDPRALMEEILKERTAS